MTPSLRAVRRHRFRTENLLLLPVVLTAGFLLTAWASVAMQRIAAEAVVTQLEGHTERLQQEIINRIQQAEYGLHAFRAALIVKPDLTRADFQAIFTSRDMWSEFRGLRGFGFIERVERSALGAFLTRQQADGEPDFQVRTAGAAKELFIVRYIEPVAANRQALGYDLMSDPVRRQTLEAAAQSGKATLTQRIILLQDERSGPGMLYLLPVYDGPQQQASEGQPRGRLRGFVHAPVVAAETLGHLQSFVDFTLDFRLYEGLPAAGHLLVDSLRTVDPLQKMPPDDAFASRVLQQERQFSIGDRLFTLQVATRPGLEGPVAGALRPAVMVACAGVMLTLLLGLVVNLLLRGKARAQAMSQRITADLQQTTLALEASHQRLTDSEELMRLITDSIPGRIVYWDREGRCRFANREFLKAVGRTRAGALGQPAETVFGDRIDPERATRVATVLTGESVVFEQFAPPSDDSPARTLRIHLIPNIQDGQVQGFFGLGMDITDLRRAHDEAVQASLAKSQFVANMSHELRTPMNAVLGMLQLVQHTSLNSLQQSYLSKAEGAALALLSVLNDILDFSKVEAGKMRLDPREFEIDGLLRDLSVIFATAVSDKPVEFIYEIAPDVPCRLVADDMRLRQVLINLGGNAVKFTQQGHVKLAVRLAHQADGNPAVELSITDTGIGIAPEHLRRVFQDFGQAEASTTRRFGGTGLGLAISRKLVALMGGELRVDSVLGQGSCFRFILPLVTVPCAAESSQPALPADERRAAILLVDSTPLTSCAHAAMVEQIGRRAMVVGDASEALAVLATQGDAVEAVMVDWMAGDDVPLAVARRIGATLSGTRPVLLVTGKSEANELLAQLEPARQQHILACLTRPLTPGMLAATLAAVRESAPAVPSPPPVPPRPLAGLRVLVAEDNANNQLVARELLSSQGAEVVIAADGVEAVERVQSDAAFDAVLMDWQMPRMDGLQACAQLRSLGFAHLPIIAMTANAMESDRVQCLAAGMNDHVAKPFVLRALVATLLQHTAGRARPRHGHGHPAPAPAAPASLPAPAPRQAQPALLDRLGAIEQLGGNTELYEQLLPMFCADLRDALAVLEQALQGQADAGEACRKTHTLKGNAGTLGALRLAEAAWEMEAILKRGDPAHEAFAQLQDVARETLAVLEAA